MIAIRSWRDVTIIDHSNAPTSTALSMRCPVFSSAICDVQHPDFLLVLLSMAIHQHRIGELTGWLLHIALSSLSDWHYCFSRSSSFYQILLLLFQFVLWHPSCNYRCLIYSCQGNRSRLPFLFLHLQPVCPICSSNRTIHQCRQM